uniref:Uncharacterized protein n=1 Tax=Cacopsylla melanoneura TaxID=428564 RepID=A0A8D8Z803_9HEMI
MVSSAIDCALISSDISFSPSINFGGENRAHSFSNVKSLFVLRSKLMLGWFFKLWKSFEGFDRFNKLGSKIIPGSSFKVNSSPILQSLRLILQLRSSEFLLECIGLEESLLKLIREGSGLSKGIRSSSKLFELSEAVRLE